MSNQVHMDAPAAPIAGRQAKRRSTISWLGAGIGIILLVYYICIFVIPFITAIWLSFHNWDYIVEPRFIGLRNYQRMLGDEYFWKALGVTITFSVMEISLGIILALMLAFLLSRLRGLKQRALLALFYLPVMTPSIVTVLLWRWLYIRDGGAFNGLLGVFGIPPQPFLLSNNQALFAIVLMVVWANLGGIIVLFLAGINDIPEHLFEAAQLDGARTWTQFRFIVLPLLRPIIFYQVVVSVIGTFQLFEQFVFLSGPGFSTRTLALYTYELGFRSLDLGYGAAVSIVIFLLLLVATSVQLRQFRAGFEY